MTRAQPTVLLLHTTSQGRHHDWFIGDPRQAGMADARLWTARVAHASRHWARLGRFALTPLPPHRRHYLRYQGPISGGRGSVQRVDAGWVIPLLWTESRIVLDVHLRMFCGRIELRRVHDQRWEAFCPREAAEPGSADRRIQY
ncbi:MAG TPA: hypothetical protein VF184_00935 [Phycisphaeraceae bacterium]